VTRWTRRHDRDADAIKAEALAVGPAADREQDLVKRLAVTAARYARRMALEGRRRWVLSPCPAPLNCGWVEARV
jgi:hypothetical protein